MPKRFAYPVGLRCQEAAVLLQKKTRTHGLSWFVSYLKGAAVAGCTFLARGFKL